MNRAEKDKLKRYGKLVWDFSNSKTTDDILTSFFENLQSAFNFSGDFKEKAIKIRPTKQSTIGLLSEKENHLFEVMDKRKKILSNINSALNCSFSNIDQYDPVTFMFTISESEWERRQEDTIIESGGEEKTISIPASEIEAYILKNLIVEYDEINLKAEIKELIELSHQIEDMKSESTNRFAFIESLNKDYERISKLHNYVNAQQTKLKTVLVSIIEAEQAFESEGFKSILSRYNSIRKQILVVNHQQKLVEVSTFVEDNFLNDKYFHFEDIFNSPISYCLVEFLKNPEYQGKERISFCPMCEFIFSKSKLNGKQKYCPACSRKNKMTTEEWNAYQKKYRASLSRKRREAKKKREAKIQHLMTNAGKTRKEAEQILDNDM